MATIKTCYRFCQLNKFNKYRNPLIGLSFGPKINSSIINWRFCHNNNNNNSNNQTNDSNDGKDIEKLFLDSKVQTILKRLTGFDPQKIFKSKPVLKVSSAQYKFMTQKELEMVCILFILLFISINNSFINSFNNSFINSFNNSLIN
jgi:hypothetical protein